MIKKLSIIGSGSIGTVVARLAVKSGIKVTIANSRGPETLTELIQSLGPNIEAATVEDAASTSEIIVVSIPFFRYKELLPELFKDKIVIDTMNYDPARDVPVKDLMYKGKMPAEFLQEHLASAKIIKAFSSINFRQLELLARPQTATDRSALPIAGVDKEAKEKVADLLDKLGWDTVDAGTLADTKLFDLGQPAFVVPYLRAESEDWISDLATDMGKQLDKQQLKELLKQSSNQ